MPKLVNGQLSHVPNKGFRASVGYYLKDDRRTPKVFWLGHDPVVAHYHANQARGSWQAITLRGGSAWTHETLTDLKEAVDFFRRARLAIFSKHARDKKRVEEQVQTVAVEGEMLRDMFGTPPERQTTANEPPPVEPPKPIRLHATLDLYKVAMKAKALSPSYKRRTEECVDTLKTFRPDVDLLVVDRVWLETLTDEMKARPLSRKKDRRTKKRSQSSQVP